MPQMAPISWLILFLIFSMTFIMFCMMNYYMYMYAFITEIYWIKKY